MACAVLSLYLQVRGVYTYSVGFCVARSDKVGNARASECGTGDWLNSHALLFM